MIFKKDCSNNICFWLKKEIPPSWIGYFLTNILSNDYKIQADGEILHDFRNLIVKIKDEKLNKDIIIKYFRLTRKYDHFRFRFISSKAKRSLNLAIALLDIGLKTPEPIAVVEKRGRFNKLLFSYYISEFVDYDFNLIDIAKDYDHPKRSLLVSLLPKLGKEIRKMHEHGIIHNDLHAGNILVKYENDEPEFYYIDLNRGRVKNSLSIKEKVKDLARLKISDQEKEIFLQAYSPDNYQKLLDKMISAREKRRKLVSMKSEIRDFFNIKQEGEDFDVK